MKLSIETLKIPFKVGFSHSSACRTTTEAVLVKAALPKSITGYGEGCPRQYVTDETMESVQAFFVKHQSSLEAIQTLHALQAWADTHEEAIDANPSAFCAIELALLDALAKQQGVSVEALLGLKPVTGQFRYSAVLGTRNAAVFQAQLAQYAKLGFRQYKVKLFGDEEGDRKRLATMREMLSSDVEIRADANNYWHQAYEAIRYLNALGVPLVALEEPVVARDYPALQAVSQALELPVILDESFSRIGHFQDILPEKNHWIINIRISKMGGILRSLAVAERAKQEGIPIIIGAQVGETSLLTRAALTIAASYKDILIAQEGAFGTYLLEQDITTEPIMFASEGLVEADFNQGTGFGIAVCPDYSNSIR